MRAISFFFIVGAILSAHVSCFQLPSGRISWYNSRLNADSGSNEDDNNNSKNTGGNIGKEDAGSIVNKIPEYLRSDDFKSYSISIGLALLFRAFIVEPRYIPSLSMYPTFEVGDQLAVDKISKVWREYQRRDVVVFTPPQTFIELVTDDPGFSRKGREKEALIKRIVAIEGDVVKVRKGKLYVNDVEQSERYVNEDAAYELGPIKVPEGMVFVLGDNRNHSLDGHIWGFLPKENIIGRAVLKYWPIPRLSTVETS